MSINFCYKRYCGWFKVQMELIKKPVWVRVRPPAGENYTNVKQSLRMLNLHT
ncbi:MAG: hypothetical protein ACRD6U_11360, partial [Nitrososphaeraceae archaeon]